MANVSQIRSLGRTSESSVLSVDTSLTSPANTFFLTAVFPEATSSFLPRTSLLPSSQPASATMKHFTTPSNPSPIKMNHQYPHLERQGTDSADVESLNIRTTGRGRARRANRYATVIDGAVYSAYAATQAVGHFTSTEVVSCGYSMRRASVSTTRATLSYIRSRSKSVAARFRSKSRGRPTISEPDHPRLVASMTEPQGKEQPLVRYAAMTREGGEFPPQHPKEPKDPVSSHDMDTPDPLRCHPVQPRPNDGSPAITSTSYQPTLQNLTSSQRWKRNYEQEHHLLMTLRQQIAAHATELKQNHTEIAQLRHDLEEQRTRAEHFQTALAIAQKENIATYLDAGSPADLQEYVATMESQVRNLVDDNLHAEALARKETLAVNTQKMFLDMKTRQIEELRMKLEQEQAKSRTLQMMLEEQVQAKLSRNSIDTAKPTSLALPVAATLEQHEDQAAHAPPAAPSQTFKNILEKNGIPQHVVSSSSNIDLLLPLPSSSTDTALNQSGETAPFKTSSENMSKPLAMSQVAEKKARPTSALRSFKLPKVIARRAMDAQVEEEVPALKLDSESTLPASSQSFDSQAEVLTTQPDAEASAPPPSQTYKAFAYKEIHTTESNYETTSYRSSVISTVPFPEYEEFYPESPTLPPQSTFSPRAPASDHSYQAYEAEERCEYYPYQEEEQEEQHSPTPQQQTTFTTGALHQEPASPARSTCLDLLRNKGHMRMRQKVITTLQS
ncbi:hypothetical protein BDZ45DRAFT_739966 [Acephala macrosclerotiorum]|nr:hypothetical protein BDZ45DRAFT_739966 [Acephala macrosclerotiorum]